ncbi:MAG TPA: hypothetical protein VI172_08340 [Candidatus Dormibacteraeota bacterium]|jgi:hypothetical protein
MTERSKDRHKPRATIASADDDGLWTELGQVVGENRRSEVTRQLWAAFLKRPGVKIPRRRDYETQCTQKPATPEDGGPNEAPR